MGEGKRRKKLDPNWVKSGEIRQNSRVLPFLSPRAIAILDLYSFNKKKETFEESVKILLEKHREVYDRRYR